MRPVTVAVLVFVAVAMVPTARVFSSPSGSPAVLYTSAKRYDALAWVEGGERFGAGATVYVADGHGRHPLVPAFAASADPAVSFDARRVLFAGKRTASDPWQIWEVPLRGGNPKQITNCPADCVRPLYLPEDRIVYAEKLNGRFIVQTAALADGHTLRLTYGTESAFPTDVLQDGRVLFESTTRVDGRAIPEIYTVYSDGSGVESYRCDHAQARHSGTQLRSGDIVFAEERGLARFTSSRAKEMPVSAPDGEYAGGIAESSAGEWFLPWRANAKSFFQLMKWKSGQGTLLPAAQERGAHILEPVLLTERRPPNRHPSALHDWPVGNLLCLNAYTSKYDFPAASIRSVKVYTRSSAGAVQLLGVAPVEADGSFYVQVPGDQPLQIELLDAAGKTLKREAGFFWLRHGEQRVCVGCHAGPETAPENAVPLILLKSTTPADMTHPTVQSSAGGH